MKSLGLKWMIGLWVFAMAMLMVSQMEQRSTAGLPAQEREPIRDTVGGAESGQAAGFDQKESCLKEEANHLADRFGRSLAAIEQEPDGPPRDKKIQDWLDGIPPADVPAVLKLLERGSSSELCQDVEARLTRRWTKVDPVAAATWAQQMPSGGLRPEALTAVAITWANMNATNAIQWASRLPEGVERQKALTSVGFEVARADPAQALKLAVDLPPNRSRDDLISFTATQWAATAPGEAAGWAQQIPDEGLRVQILGKIATEWGDEDPVKGADMALTLPPGKIQNAAIISIVERWAQKDPQTARAWVEEFPEGTLRATALDNLEKLAPEQN